MHETQPISSVLGDFPGGLLVAATPRWAGEVIRLLRATQSELAFQNNRFLPPILSCFNDPMKQTFLSNTSVAAIISMVTFVLHADDPVALSRNKAISLAFANNRDLKIATLEIERAKTRVRWSGRLENCLLYTSPSPRD